jgi:hypothetical protein
MKPPPAPSKAQTKNIDAAQDAITKLAHKVDPKRDAGGKFRKRETGEK